MPPIGISKTYLNYITFFSNCLSFDINSPKYFHNFLKSVSDSFQGLFNFLLQKYLDFPFDYQKRKKVLWVCHLLGHWLLRKDKYFKIPNFKSKSQSLDLRRNKQNFSDQNRYLCPRDTKEDKKFHKFLADYLFTAIISWRNKNWLFNKCSR